MWGCWGLEHGGRCLGSKVNELVQGRMLLVNLFLLSGGTCLKRGYWQLGGLIEVGHQVEGVFFVERGLVLAYL